MTDLRAPTPTQAVGPLSPASTAGPQKGETASPKRYTCEVCGASMLSVHCKIRCQVCGYTRDCSDP